jgi:hypothetical protein
MWQFASKERKGGDKRLAPTKQELILETIPENMRIEPWGLLPSGALNAPPMILSSNYFELNYEDGAHYI